jgi:argininosuccinate lyase
MTGWKGRFRKPLNPGALAFSTSIEVDRRLAAYDVQGSLAHAAMLGARGIIPKSDVRKILAGLKEIGREIASGRTPWLRAPAGGGRFVAEDVHMAVEQRLLRKIGPAGGRLHTARSRNDQVALDVRLYLRDVIDETGALLSDAQRALLGLASDNQTVIMPGYTHLQRAQPVLLAHHLLAYVEMLGRDGERFRDCRTRVNRSPLGAAALAGTSFRIDRRSVARQLGFDAVLANSIDAVSDRDVLVEFLSAASITMMHLSRLAEELVLWTSSEWGFAAIGDDFTTGSSIMPQKKNPDMAELIRGKTGRVYGGLMALLTMLKGLPLAYNRDLQEDKGPVFDAADTLTSSLRVLTGMLATVTFSASRFETEMDGDFLMATELADHLARRGMPFREAHAVVGKLVAACDERKCSLSELPLTEYQRLSDRFHDIPALLSARASVGRKRSEGSTSPAEVSRAIRRWRKKLARAASGDPNSKF